jgi:uncharacterized protein
MNERLRLLVFNTEQCNFRCVYCNQRFITGRMSTAIIKSIKHYLHSRLDELKHLTVSWIGGEPLLAMGVIEDISQFILDNKKENLFYSSDITTNGYLLNPTTFRRLICLGINHFQISFDGTKEFHDTRRIQRDGSGSFDKIWDNVVQIAKQESVFNVIVRLHLDGTNLQCADRFIEDYIKVFEGDDRFTLFIRPVAAFGGPNDDKISFLSKNQGIEIVESLRRNYSDKNIKITTMQDDPETMCYASNFNFFAIRADGRINKCSVALEEIENQIGNINLDGTLTLNNDRALKWSRGFETQDLNELSCPARYILNSEPV